LKHAEESRGSHIYVYIFSNFPRFDPLQYDLFNVAQEAILKWIPGGDKTSPVLTNIDINKKGATAKIA
jgi:hypothetical protein